MLTPTQLTARARAYEEAAEHLEQGQARRWPDEREQAKAAITAMRFTAEELYRAAKRREREYDAE